MRASRMAAEESAAAFKNPRLDLRWLFIGKPSLVGVDPEAFHRTFRMVWMLRWIRAGSVKCPWWLEGVSHILLYLNDVEHQQDQTRVGSIMEMIAATVVGSCWPKAPSSV